MRPQNGLIGLVLANVLALVVPHALADRDYAPRPDADIERLKGSLVSLGDRWRADIDYKVEVEGRWAHRTPLVLSLLVTDDQGVLTDPSGRPIEAQIPLDRPSDIDDDELQYEAGIALDIPNGAFPYPDRLQVEARVIDERDGAVMDHDRSRIRFDAPIVYEPVVVERPVVVDPVIVERPVVYAPAYPAPVVVARPCPPPVVYGGGLHIGVHVGSFGHTRVIHHAPPSHVYRRVVAPRPSHHAVRVRHRP